LISREVNAMTTVEVEKRTQAATARVLVVDDEEEILRVFREFLADEGYEVVGCYGGAQACQKIRTEEFDLVVTDMVMSPVPGEEVLRCVSEHSPGTEVIVITAFTTFDRLQEALRRRVYDFVEKPVNLPELARTVRGAVGKARAIKREERQMADLQTRNQELIGELKRATADLAPDVLEDPATGLPGYQAFRSFLETEINRSVQTLVPLTLAMLDMNLEPAFEEDTGREREEAFAGEVGEFLRCSIRREDMVFRYGERQFAIVFPAGGSEGVRKCLERLIGRTKGHPWEAARDEETPRAVFAAGLATAPGDAEDFDDLVRAADQALEAARRDSRVRIHHA
jgi:diguanylate cyclase (GGDEF)-like protein